MAAPLPERASPIAETPARRGAAVGLADADSGPAAAAGQALRLRDQALAALDEGDPGAALSATGEALAALERAGLDNGPDAAAVLVARAEIEESLDRFGDAAATAAAAATLLDRVMAEDEDDDSLMLWCQAQERLAGLERLGGDFGAAAARLWTVLDRASAAFGEASPGVVSAANALGVVHKHAGDLDAAEATYRRALAAASSQGDASGQGDPDPLALAALLHNLGGLAHARGDAATGIPLAEQGAGLRAGALGSGHPDVARDWNALGALYHLAGRFGDAERVYGQALAVFGDYYGADHFEVAMTCANLAVLHGDQGQHAEAESLGRRSLRILEAVLGPDDAEVGLTLLNLAVAVAEQGRQAEAAELTARAVAILTIRLPPGHPHVLAADQALARLASVP